MEWNNENETTNEEDEVTFLPYRQLMKDDGVFTFTFTSVSHNENAGTTGDSECITLIDTDTATAVTMWAKSHPDSLYPVADDKTDGAKLGRALRRAFKGSNWEEVFSNANAGGKLTVAKNDFPASPTGFAWLWTVKA
tara:strand:- start:641 stop:1051 length:411 start_codon:yes stop_codon:yes gene_type:complete